MTKLTQGECPDRRHHPQFQQHPVAISWRKPGGDPIIIIIIIFFSNNNNNNKKEKSKIRKRKKTIFV